MSDDAELNELERFEALVRGPGWVPDIDKGDGSGVQRFTSSTQ